MLLTGSQKFPFVTVDSWIVLLQFLQRRRWMRSSSAGTAIIEIATHFHKSGFKISGNDEQLRAVFRHWDGQQFIPAPTESGRKSNGRNFPAGIVPNCELHLGSDALLCLAAAFNSGREYALNGWQLALCDL